MRLKESNGRSTGRIKAKFPGTHKSTGRCREKATFYALSIKLLSDPTPPKGGGEEMKKKTFLAELIPGA